MLAYIIRAGITAAAGGSDKKSQYFALVERMESNGWIRTDGGFGTTHTEGQAIMMDTNFIQR